MKIKTLQFFSYQLPLNHTLHIGQNKLDQREGIIVELTTNDGNTGYGEIAPLPGLHNENLNDVSKQLHKLYPLLLDIEISNDNRLFLTLDTILDRKKWLQTVRFGIEMAIINCILGFEIFDPKLIPRQPLANTVPVNALLNGDNDQIINKASECFKRGYNTLKIKVGRQSAEKDIQLIRDINDRLKGKAKIRLDANRQWELQTTIDVLQSLKDCNIDYVEEPLKNPRFLPMVYKKTGISLALDESLSELSIEEIKNERGIKALVIKPAVLGSLEKTIQYLHFCHQEQITAVLSDTYYSGIGLSFLIHLAAKSGFITPMGFDTYQSLADDIFIDRLNLVQGSYILKDVLQKSRNIDFGKIKILST